MMRFKDKRVIVSGAGQGIGREICAQFAQAGAWVGLNDLDPDLAQRTAKELGSQVTALPGDVSDVSFVQSMIKEFGPLDILVANAGITNYGPFLDFSPEDFQQVVDVNLRGTYFSAQAAAKNMIDHGRDGRIIFMASVCGVTAHENLSAYGMTKAGIRHLASCLALELGPHGINVNAIGAGATVTERTLKDDPNYETNWNAVSANKRTAQVGDIAGVALFLAGDEARHVTGEIIMVDGGWTIHSPLPKDHPQVNTEG
jgi:NAD(P)-dependent dehydrogenase (short-subunit alcohol dehydrogenase family)